MKPKTPEEIAGVPDELYRVTGHRFVIEIVFRNGLVYDVAAIMCGICPIGAPKNRCLEYFRECGWEAQRVN